MEGVDTTLNRVSSMRNGNRYTHLLTVATAIFWHATTCRWCLKSLEAQKLPPHSPNHVNIHEFSCAIKLGLQTRPSLPFNFKRETSTKAEIGFMQLQ